MLHRALLDPTPPADADIETFSKSVAAVFAQHTPGRPEHRPEQRISR